MVRRISSVVVAVASLLFTVSTSRAADGMPPCPEDGFQPLGEAYTGPGLSILIPPLALLLASTRDRLADEPRRDLTFRAIDAAGRRVEGAHIALLHEGRRYIGETVQDGRLSLPDGTYTVIAAVEGAPARWGLRRIDTRGKDGAPGASEFEVKIDRTMPAIGPKPASDLSADGRASAGGTVRFAWTGPRQAEASLAVVTRGAEGGKASSETKVGNGATRAVEMPPIEGAYDVRLLACAPRITLARWPIDVGPAAITLAAPDKVAAGERFEVTAGGRIGETFSLAVVTPGGEREIVAEDAERGKPRARLVAPLAAGRWDVVYRAADDDHTVLARRALVVEGGRIEISAPDEVRLGAPVTIYYPGSDHGGGAVMELWSKDGIRWSDDLPIDGKRLPARVGEHELRLVDRDDHTVILARRPIRIVGSVLSAPDTVAPGTTMTVALAQTPQFFDVVRIVPRGTAPGRVLDGPKVDPNQERSAVITAPSVPGDYDLLLVDESPGTQPTVVIDRRPLTVR